MSKELIKYALIFLALVLSQVVVFNHICLFGMAIPLVFIYFIIKLPITLGVNWLMTLSFFDHRHICQHTRNECHGLHSVGSAP